MPVSGRHGGIPWSAIADVQVRNVNGGRSAATLVGSIAWYSVMTALLLPIASMHIDVDVPNLPGSEFGRTHPTVPADATAPDVATADSAHLFAWQARAYLRLRAHSVLTLDAPVSARSIAPTRRGPARPQDRPLRRPTVAGARRRHVRELTADGAHVAGSMRVGAHFDLDAQRYAIDFGFDLGALGGDDREGVAGAGAVRRRNGSPDRPTNASW